MFQILLWRVPIMPRDRTGNLFFSVGLAAALLALCLRLIVPVGWMPVASVGSVTFTLCSGSGARQLPPELRGTPVAPDDGAAQDGGCAFVGMGAPALPDTPPALALLLFGLVLSLGFGWPSGSHRQIATWLRPPLRGPPLAG
jgi:hypothetical protein